MLSPACPHATANGFSLIGEVGDVTVGDATPSHSTVHMQGMELELVSTAQEESSGGGGVEEESSGVSVASTL